MGAVTSSPAGGLSVLLVEDDHALGSAVAKFLGICGYTVHVCPDGASALDHVSTFRPDAIITDVHLPDINGLVLSQKFRSNLGAAVPIIVLSGDTSVEVLKSLSHVGATYFLNKPVNFELLRERLADYLAVGARA